MSPEETPKESVVDPARWSEMRPIVEATLLLSQASRAAFLDAACATDAALRNDVMKLVEACEVAQAGDFMAEAAAAFAAPLVAEMANSPQGQRSSPRVDAALRASLQAALAGHYDIQRELGRGGMATVYLAHDHKHDRLVAIKLLEPAVADALGSERFLAEIRVTANLHHPHLLPLFDSGDANGLLYYVMPYVEGASLRERLRREQQLPVEEAVQLAIGVAGALDYAHRHGVIHRDLKPENILLHDGQPLVADFGIALAASNAGGVRLTQRGLSLGTPQYMSPEQALVDQAIDGRSDIYSLACVLYEALSGDPPHTGSTVQAVLAKVLAEPARNVRIVRPTVPLHVAATLDRALSKIPADRFQTARAFADALAHPDAFDASSLRQSQTRVNEPGQSANVRVPWRDPLLLGLAAAALIGIGAAAWLYASGSGQATPQASRFMLNALGDAPRDNAPTITPDGHSLVYAASDSVSNPAGSSSASRAVWVRQLSELRARRLEGTEGATSVFVSPDGAWIGFFTADDRIKKVALRGGQPIVITGAFRFSRARWAPSGAIVTDSYGRRGLAWIPDSGGVLRPLTRIDGSSGESAHMAPFVLPDGKSVIFTIERQRGGPAPLLGELAVVSFDAANGNPLPRTLLGVHGRQAVAFVNGWLLYTGSDGNSIMAIRYDDNARRTVGKANVVLQDADGRLDGVAVANDGTLLYTRSTTTNAPMLVDGAGVATPVLGDVRGEFMNPRLSPNGRQLAVQATSPQGSDIWIYEIASRTPTRLTVSGNAFGPAWTPDGRRIIFLSTQGGRSAFWRQVVDGSAPAEKLVEADGMFAGTMTPDGQTLLFQRQVGNSTGIWSASVNGDRTPRPLVKDQFDDYMPAISPDGKWLAYVSNASGRYEVYVRPYVGTGAPVQVSELGGTEPVWSPDGSRLVYRGERRFLAVTVSTAPTFAVKSRERLFADSFLGEMPHSNFDITRDGKGVVTIASRTEGGQETIIVLNWLTELRRRLASAQ
jgi:serine/threonine protein kinase